MNVKTFALAGAAGAMIAGAASADLLGVFTSEIAPNVWSVYAQFDNPADRVDGVASNANQQVTFSSTQPLLNAVPQDIFLNFAGDSGIGVGNGGSVTPGWPSASPTFPNGNGTVSGTNWSVPLGEGWFQAGGVQASLDQWGITGAVQIAYFSFAEPFDFGAGEGFTFTGELQYVLEDGSVLQQVYSVTNIPAPGALALLGVAGLAGTRRRRG